MKIPQNVFLQAVALLKSGQPIAFPTETVYGLGAPIFDEQAVKKIFELKGRPADNPVIAHVSSLSEVDRIAEDLPESFFLLARRFWPGPLTIVLKRRAEVPAIVSAGHQTIAIRMPAHPVAQKLIQAVGQPLVAPSANISGRPSPTRPADVREDFKEKIYILDGGECPIGIESTVLSLIEPTPVLLRPGSISQKDLEEALKRPIALATPSDPVHSPGMKHRHYAPRAKVTLVFDLAEVPEGGYLISSIPVRSSLVFTRRNFYSRLREADRLDIQEIIIYCDPVVRQDAGLMNRVFRASGLN